ncbi:histidinol dehydrogenase [Geochorda subterranea]|uniref:Histidinol dehydrogenase n=1 Tax=Geochorda subterranea TaxID=3109564 RepID=A0ABZ1BUW6_9FIRM|nr:histidinol dehydrogenase [Limnochorda sp. LNt]WRP15922.1 histidinol dehydrogenase [Limnochorda sp. LNt]
MRRFDTRRQSLDEIRAALRRPLLWDVPVTGRARATLDRLFGPGTTPLEAVRRILDSVRREGDAALVRWTRELDRVEMPPGELWVGAERLQAAASDPSLASLVPPLRAAAAAIERFHRRQAPAPVFEESAPGIQVGWWPRPVRRAAVYVPGGLAPLLSTVLMGVIPARIAGVEEIVVATPPPVHPGILLAARLAGADRVLQVGGAQAVAALAYGTESVPPVDVIVGPGNLFVQLAKREVVGIVGIDALAGPSEVVVMADGEAPSGWIAADLVAQAEHAPDAAAILVSDSEPLVEAVLAAIERELSTLARGDLARSALEAWGAAIVCRSLDPEGVELVSTIAPEHLEVVAQDAIALAGRVRSAGAIFIGPHSPVALGDYAAGSNHILPTNGTARFASGLGVHTFVRASAMVHASPRGLAGMAGTVQALASAEGLEAHARSIAVRLEADDRRGGERR